MHYHHYTLQFPAQLLHVLHAMGIGLAQLLLTDVFCFVQSLSTTLTIVAGNPVVEKDRSATVMV